MQEGATLKPEDRVSHYRIVGPLGAGGMGEVYLAQDQTLDRSVALKILPPSLIRNEDRVRRFVLEAKSASSLNHPNIVTIYEIGQDEVKGSDGTSSSSVHFISMELVSGETLSTKIHHENTDLRTLLGYLAQAADGIAKAHAAGIVHRDLKPGNIMVSKDGYAKVLDFGLAKLTEKRDADPDLSHAPTLAEATSIGSVLGTVGYMSPEQVAGKPVDARSDVFSFGCILYEAATRQRPFTAETGVETMHKILNERPVPVEDINPKAPAELRRAIRRCLAKSPDQRFQSMKDVAIELREIVDEYDSLSPSASSGSGSSAAGMSPAKGSSKRGFPIVPVAGVVVVVALAFAAWSSWHSRKSAAAGPPRTPRISTQTSRGDVEEATISPDGRYLAYIVSRQAQTSVFVRQIATGSDVEVVPKMNAAIYGLTFTPDGNYLFFLGPKRENPRFHALYQVPSLGGTPRERAFDVDTRASFAPDGKHYVFIRGVPVAGHDLLIVRELESGKEQTLATFNEPAQDWTPPSWSPDGKHIAVGFGRGAPLVHSAVTLYPVGGGKPVTLPLLQKYSVEALAWMPDGSGFVIEGTDWTRGLNSQVSLLKKSGERSPITNDMSRYIGAMPSSGDEAVATVRSTATLNLWVADAGGAPPLSLTSFSNPENAITWSTVADSSTLLFGAPQDGGAPVFAIPARGGAPRKLTESDGQSFSGRGFPGGAVFGWYDTKGDEHVWKINADGSGLAQITSGAGESPSDVSSDGRFVSYNDAAGALRWVPLQGGGSSTGYKDPVTGQVSAGGAGFSPDGATIDAGTQYVHGNRAKSIAHTLPVAGGAEIATDSLPEDFDNLRWGPGSRNHSFTLATDDGKNLYSQSLGQSRVTQVTHFTDGRIADFKWSWDGSRVVIVRDFNRVQNLWVTNADGSHPVQVTHFTTELIGGFRWLPDNRRIMLTAGPLSRDAVLVRGFR